MPIKIEKAAELGFCFGVRRAIDMLEKTAHENGGVDTLGALVHNEQVTQDLAGLGVNIINNLQEIKSDTVAISAHGVSPQVEAELRARNAKVIDTTCPDVKRVQNTARNLVEDGFFVVVFGDAQHAEVKGILGYTADHGMATLNAESLIAEVELPPKLAILSQTTQIPEYFTKFVNAVIDSTLNKCTEIRIFNTICRSVRKRQLESLKLARQVELLLIVGGKDSANTRRLFELCSPITRTYLIETADEINPAWLSGKQKVGVSGGTSTPEQVIDETVKHLKYLSSEKLS